MISKKTSKKHKKSIKNSKPRFVEHDPLKKLLNKKFILKAVNEQVNADNPMNAIEILEDYMEAKHLAEKAKRKN